MLHGGDARFHGALLIGAGDATVKAGDGEVRHDVERPAAFDLAAVDGDVGVVGKGLGKLQDQLSGGEDGAAAGGKIPAGVGGAAVQDEGEVAGALAGTD